MTTVSILDIAKSVKFSDRSPSASVASIEAILDIALRTRLGIMAMSAEGVTVELGNGYSLVCKAVKHSVEVPT